MKNKLKEFLELYLAFVKIGAFTFGGGLAMMPIMQRELIEKRGVEHCKKRYKKIDEVEYS